jgi:pimeloyl-ACP methyl ester carboxylesterase
MYEVDRFHRVWADLAALIDHIGPPRVALAGMSMGGTTAQNYAVRHPDRVAALALVDVSPHVVRSVPHNFREQVFMPSFGALLEHAREVYPRQTPETVLYDVFHNARQLPDGTWCWKEDRRPRPPEDVAVTRPRWERHAEELEAGLRTLSVPVLVVRGQHSRILPPETAQRFVDALRDGRLATIPNAGHAVQTHNPVALARALNGFLAPFVSADGSSWRAAPIDSKEAQATG